MSKTDLTLRIEKAIRSYRPVNVCGIKINIVRGQHTAFEVPVTCGETKAGLIDCVRVSEYFYGLETVGKCRIHGYRKLEIPYLPLSEKDCALGCKDERDCPEYCNIHSCYSNYRVCEGKPNILIQCYEIKISKSDFKSKNGHNFVGNLNFYVVPSELYESIKDYVPDDIGIIIYSKGCLRRKKDAVFKQMTDEEQKWMILNVLKKRS